MRILMLSQTPQRRGAETFALQLRDALVDRGHEGKIVYLYAYGGTEPIRLGPEDECLEFDAAHPLERWLTLNPALLRAVRQQIQTYRPDILHLNGARSVKYGAVASIGTGVRVVYRNIDSPKFWNTDWKRQAYYRHVVFPRIDGVSGVSQKTLDEVRDMYRLSDDSTVMRFIPNAVEVAHLRSEPRDVRAELGIDPSVPVVLFFGKLTEQKRPDRWVRTFAKLKERVPAARGLIVGDGQLRAVTEQALREHGLVDDVTLVGYQRTVAPYLNAGNLLLLSSDTEGIPAAILEAGYLGVPVVAPRIGGVHECVRHGETGLLVDRNDEDTLAEAAASVLDQPQRLAAMGAAAERYVRESFLMDAVVPEYERLYRDVLAAG